MRQKRPPTRSAPVLPPITVTARMVLAPEVNTFIQHAMRDARAEEIGTRQGQKRLAAMLRERGWRCTPPRTAQTRKAVA